MKGKPKQGKDADPPSKCQCTVSAVVVGTAWRGRETNDADPRGAAGPNRVQR